MVSRPLSRRRERGAALIVVLIVLVLMAALSMEVATTARTHSKLAEHGMDGFLLRTAVESRQPIMRACNHRVSPK